MFETNIFIVLIYHIGQFLLISYISFETMLLNFKSWLCGSPWESSYA